MHSSAIPHTIEPMAPPSAATDIRIHIEADGPAVHGTVFTGGRAVDFAGWLEFLAVLMEVVDRLPEP